MAITSIGLHGAEVAVIALTVVCVTLVMLPLNHQLVLLLKSHTYAAYDNMASHSKRILSAELKLLIPDCPGAVLQLIPRQIQP